MEGKNKQEGLSKHLSAVFVSSLWRIYYYHMRLQQPTGNRDFLSKSCSEKGLLMALDGQSKVKRSRLVNAWVIKRSRVMMSGYRLMLYMCMSLLKRVNACCGCVSCLLGDGWCIYLFLVQFPDSTQILSVHVGSVQLKHLQAEDRMP